MYRQIVIDPEDRKFQCILWQNSVSDPIHIFELNTVTYGLSSSPFQALRTMQQLATDVGANYPLAAHTLLRDVTGADTVGDAQELKTQLVALLGAGGFQLHKWCSNHGNVVGTHDTAQADMKFDSMESVNVLGIHWTPSKDEFCYKVKVPTVPNTKRDILSFIAQLYDPCGWLAPVITASKILLQVLWTKGLGWDDQVDKDVLSEWKRFTAALPLLSRVRFIPLQELDVQFHGFCDTSEKVYAALMYVRCVTRSGEVTVRLLMVKSRVAPLKTLSIPKLELCAAHLLRKLCLHVLALFQPKVKTPVLHAWTDSTVVLAWLRMSPHTLQTFVANRVAEIQIAVPPSAWKHVPSECNPADAASRGCLPAQLLDQSCWFGGPGWLLQKEEHWPSQAMKHHWSIPKLKPPSVVILVAQHEEKRSEDPLGLIQNASSLSKLQAVTAWVLRAKAGFQKQQYLQDIILTFKERGAALTYLIKMTQLYFFKDAITAIKKGETCSKNIQALAPFMDLQGVVRVGGRLQNASIPERTKHRILLPAQSKLSELIVIHFNFGHLHAGPQMTLCLTRRQYWIVSGRSLVRKLLHKCMNCFKVKATALTPLMGALPVARLTQVGVFRSVGVNFAGPFLTTLVRTRRRVTFKIYMCLFVCMTTKAMVLTTTNFVGVSNHLKELYKTLWSGEPRQHILCEAAQQGIKCHFNPPASPHFGGLWEAAVKIAKQHMKRVVGNLLLTIEEFVTLLAQISAVMNSRPLCALSTDPEEYDVLTPGHFLVGEPMTAVPDHDLMNLSLNKLDRWQIVTRLQQTMWKQWSVEYLHTLQQRAKWTTPTLNVQLDQLVLVQEPNLPPLKWKTGRVTAIHPGQDGIVRVVTLKTPHGTFVRPVAKVCPLPMN